MARPGRDPREDLPAPVFKQGVLKLEDLTPGMELTGTVLNVVDFGCFVDIGMHDSGLVHVSRLADRFIRDPHEVVAVGDIVKVWVMEVDKERRRVSLTMVRPGSERPRRPARGEGGASQQGQQEGQGQAGQDQAAQGQAGRQQGDRPPRGGQGRRGGRPRASRAANRVPRAVNRINRAVDRKALGSRVGVPKAEDRRADGPTKAAGRHLPVRRSKAARRRAKAAAPPSPAKTVAAMAVRPSADRGRKVPVRAALTNSRASPNR